MRIVSQLREGHKAVLRFFGSESSQQSDISYDGEKIVLEDKVFFNKTINSNVIYLNDIHKNLAAINLDVSKGHLFVLELTANAEITSIKNAESGAMYTIVVKQDSTGGRTLTLPSSFKYASGTPPTITIGASSIDLITIFKLDSDYIISYDQDYKTTA